MRHVSRDELAGRLEPFLIARLPRGQEHFICRRFRPALVWSRLDLAIKLHYLQNGDAARALYDAHIEAFSLGNMKEPGSDKQGAETFRQQFADLYQCIRDSGFDAGQSLIPLARDGTILNGAHRVACAILAGQTVVGVETGLEPVIYDDDYFRRRGMPEADLDAALLAYVGLAPQARIALLRPVPRRALRGMGPLAGSRLIRRRSRLSLPPELAGHDRLLMLVLDAGATVPAAALWVSTSHDEACRMARLLLTPPPGACPGRGQRLLYRWRRNRSWLRHQAITLLAWLGVRDQVRRIYRSIR